MKVRNGILALLAVLALAGCSVDTVPTEPGAAPHLSAGGIITLGPGNQADGSTTTSDTSYVAERGPGTLGSGN